MYLYVNVLLICMQPALTWVAVATLPVTPPSTGTMMTRRQRVVAWWYLLEQFIIHYQLASISEPKFREFQLLLSLGRFIVVRLSHWAAGRSYERGRRRTRCPDTIKGVRITLRTGRCSGCCSCCEPLRTGIVLLWIRNSVYQVVQWIDTTYTRVG